MFRVFEIRLQLLCFENTLNAYDGSLCQFYLSFLHYWNNFTLFTMQYELTVLSIFHLIFEIENFNIFLNGKGLFRYLPLDINDI